MFQSINDEEENLDNGFEKESLKQVRSLKSFFSISDIIFYAISIMASMVSFGGEFAPFGLAIFAATCTNQIPAVIIYICTCIGTLIGFGFNGLLMYIVTTILFVILVLIFKPRYQEKNRNEKQKLGSYLFVASFIVQASKMLFTIFLWYDLLASFMFGILVYIFYKIFSNSITVIKEYGVKAFTIEEVIGASLLVAIAVYSLNKLNVFGLSVSNILSIMIVLFLGWKNGMLVGATSGITIGMVLGIIGTCNPILIASYAISRNDSWHIK